MELPLRHAVREGADVELRDVGQWPAAEPDDAGARAVDVDALGHGGAAEADARHGFAAQHGVVAEREALCQKSLSVTLQFVTKKQNASLIIYP
jgi:hypothetical protein